MSFRYELGKRRKWDAKAIRALRQHLKRTQQELAQEMGVRQQTISDWETGIYEPRGASRTLLNMIAESSSFKYRVSDQETRE